MKDTIPSSRTPVVTYGLIAANVAVFVFELSLGERLPDFLHSYGLIPFRFLRLYGSSLTELFTPFFAIFLHGGWIHILGNMLFLHIFADNVEDVMGHGRFLAFYVLCGVASFAVQIVFQPDSMVPNVGASGAIAGVLGAYFILFPTARIVTLVPLLLFFPIVEVPAFVFLGLWFIIQFLSGAASLGHTAALSGGTAWWAHIGGFVAGMLLLKGFLPGRRRRISEV